MKRILQYTVIIILIFQVLSCDEDFVSRDFPSVLTLSVALDMDGSIIFTGKLISRDSEAVDEVGFVWQSRNSFRAGCKGGRVMRV